MDGLVDGWIIVRFQKCLGFFMTWVVMNPLLSTVMEG